MSKPLSVSIPHSLGAAEAKKRLEGGLSSLTEKMPGGVSNLEQSWVGDSLHFSAHVMGQAISGVLNVLEDAVNLDLNLPGLLGLVAGKITEAVEKQGHLLLGEEVTPLRPST